MISETLALGSLLMRHGCDKVKPATRRFRPALEALEGRLVPAIAIEIDPTFSEHVVFETPPPPAVIGPGHRDDTTIVENHATPPNPVVVPQEQLAEVIDALALALLDAPPDSRAILPPTNFVPNQRLDPIAAVPLTLPAVRVDLIGGPGYMS